MAQFPCLPIWTDAWIADTHHLIGPIGRQKRGVYMDLLILMWRTPGCRVPNDDNWLQDHLGADLEELRNIVRPVIAEFCQTDGNWIIQKRLQREFIRVFEYHGRMSALRKRQKNKKNGANTARSTLDVGHEMSSTLTPTLNTYKTSSSGESQHPPPVENSPSARSLATAPDEGALTREPPTEPAQPKQAVADKKPTEKTMAEINAEAWPESQRVSYIGPGPIRQYGAKPNG